MCTSILIDYHTKVTQNHTNMEYGSFKRNGMNVTAEAGNPCSSIRSTLQVFLFVFFLVSEQSHSNECILQIHKYTAYTGCSSGPQASSLLCNWTCNSRTFHLAFVCYDPCFIFKIKKHPIFSLIQLSLLNFQALKMLKQGIQSLSGSSRRSCV